MESNTFNPKKGWAIIARLAILISVLSLFLPVIYYNTIYENESGYQYEVLYSFSALDLFLYPSEFIESVLWEYVGTTDYLLNVSYETALFSIILVVVIGVSAIIMAFVGITSMTKQYESNRPFNLTVCGLVCTAIPSVVLWIMVYVSTDQFLGAISLGLYVYITPVAMIIAYLCVTRRHRLAINERALEAEASKYIRPAGNLSSDR